jgi:hypothetical protein
MPIKFSNFERAPLNPQIAIKSHTHTKTERGSEERGEGGAEVAPKKKKQGKSEFLGYKLWQIGKKFRPRAAHKIL